MGSPFVIGLTGPLCAGKQVVIDILRTRFPKVTVLSLSDAIRHELRSANIEVTRENLIMMGNKLRQHGGAGAIAEKLVPLMQPEQSYIVDSIRHPAEVQVLSTHIKHWKMLVAVDAPLQLRFERCRKRMRENDPQQLEEFVQKDDLELYGIGDKQRIRETMAMAGMMVINRGQSVQELEADLEPLVKIFLS